VRWLFRIDFCTPRYIIYRELGMEKLRIGWEISELGDLRRGAGLGEEG